MKRIVIALGGNALGNTPEEQLRLVQHTAKSIVKVAQQGYEIMIGHGNGPQVGMINSAFDISSHEDQSIPSMPFPECGAMSQGYIGYQLQQAVENELAKQKLNKHCVSLVTQVVVDPNDPAFKQPTKPIGSFLKKEEAEKFAKEKNFSFVEDAGRGYRRVVASPKPQKIVEGAVIKQLVTEGTIVIAVGGGGIPVLETTQGYSGVPAVIDKDHSSAKMAMEIDADILIIFTAVDSVYINFNQPTQKALSQVSVAEMKQYIKEDQFSKGSMLPKIEACIDFVERTGGKAIITSLEKGQEAISGKIGTIIVND